MSFKMSQEQYNQHLHGELIEAELPRYDPPPPWIPIEHRADCRHYNGKLAHFIPRTIHLKRNKATDQLGFNIRGGNDYHCGVFISKVMPDTEAERLGLKTGDQIISVNDESFEDIPHSEAVRLLKMNTYIKLTVKYFPYAYEKTYDKTKFLQALQNR